MLSINQARKQNRNTEKKNLDDTLTFILTLTHTETSMRDHQTNKKVREFGDCSEFAFKALISEEAGQFRAGALFV